MGCPQGLIVSAPPSLLDDWLEGGAKGRYCASDQRYLSCHFEKDVPNCVSGCTSVYPEMMTLRRCMAEHPFEMLKERISGSDRLLMHGRT
jgi:hypothetical protein